MQKYQTTNTIAAATITIATIATTTTTITINVMFYSNSYSYKSNFYLVTALYFACLVLCSIKELFHSNMNRDQ